jgi:hypothetical protein
LVHSRRRCGLRASSKTNVLFSMNMVAFPSIVDGLSFQTIGSASLGSRSRKQ